LRIGFWEIKGVFSGIKDTSRRFAAPLSRGELSPLLGGDLGVVFLFALCKVEIQSSK